MKDPRALAPRVRHSHSEEEIALPRGEADAEEEHLAVRGGGQFRYRTAPSVADGAEHLAGVETGSDIDDPREYAVVRCHDEGEFHDPRPVEGRRSGQGAEMS